MISREEPPPFAARSIPASRPMRELEQEFNSLDAQREACGAYIGGVDVAMLTGDNKGTAERIAKNSRDRHCIRRRAARRQGEQGQGTPAPANKNTTLATRPIDNLHRNWKAKRAMVALTQGGQSLATLGVA